MLVFFVDLNYFVVFMGIYKLIFELGCLKVNCVIFFLFVVDLCCFYGCLLICWCDFILCESLYVICVSV